MNYDDPAYDLYPNYTCKYCAAIQIPLTPDSHGYMACEMCNDQ
jgi:hypothetical protein